MPFIHERVTLESLMADHDDAMTMDQNDDPTLLCARLAVVHMGSIRAKLDELSAETDAIIEYMRAILLAE